MRREKCFVIVTFILTMILTVQSAGDAINNKFNKKVLDLHNMYRSNHGVEQQLELDEEMCADAKSLAVAISRNVKDLPVIKYKTNIYSNFYLPNHTPIKVTPDMVVSSWYKKGADSNFPSSSTKSELTTSDSNVWAKAEAIEFIQIIWKATLKIGVGKATYERYTVVVVTYDPPAQITKFEDYADNVPPLVKKQN